MCCSRQAKNLSNVLAVSGQNSRHSQQVSMVRKPVVMFSKTGLMGLTNFNKSNKMVSVYAEVLENAIEGIEVGDKYLASLGSFVWSYNTRCL